MHTSAPPCAGMGRYWQATFRARWQQALATPSLDSAQTTDTSSISSLAQRGKRLRS